MEDVEHKNKEEEEEEEEEEEAEEEEEKEEEEEEEEEEKEEEEEEEPTCGLFQKAGTSPTLYSWKERKCKFHHRECFELPHRIKVTFHGKHRTLELRESSITKCGICWELMRGLGYSCTRKDCEFEFHVECVNSAPCIINKARRDHKFVRLPVSASYKSMSYTCEACGLDCDDVDFYRDSNYVSDVPYTCKLCNIFVHEECLKLPPTVRIRYHPRHRISHTYWLGNQEEGIASDEGSVEDEDKDEEEGSEEEEEKEEDEKVEEEDGEEEEDEGSDDEEQEQINKQCCGICDAKMNFDHGGYRCGDCGFVCHAKCTEMFIINDDEESKEEFEEPEEPSFVVIRETLVEDGEEKKIVIEEMKHFSHDHNLILLQDINEHNPDGTNTRCECCALLIQPCFSSLPSCYGCIVPGCNYYMHTSCATLPRQIRLTNETPATLVQLDRILKCDICHEYCNGFAYTYVMTQEYYCIHCSKLSLLDSVKHRGHRHARGKRSRIFLAEGLASGGSFCCDACGKQYRKNNMYFTCVPCNFYMDMNCAALPVRVKPPDGKYDDHDLVLTSRPLPSDSYQSYCLVCEEERNPARWFYYCRLCDFSAHVECVVGKYPKVNFGVLHTFQHPHPVMLVQFKGEKHPPSCHECAGIDFDVGFRCTDSGCGYIMCLKCSEDED